MYYRLMVHFFWRSDLQPRSFNHYTKKQVFRSVWWIVISKGQRVQCRHSYFRAELLISDISKDLRQPRCQRWVQKRHFNQDFKKKCLVFHHFKCIKCHYKVKRKKESETGRNKMQLWDRDTVSDIQMAKILHWKKRKGYVNHYYEFWQKRNLPLLRRKKERNRTVDTLMHQQKRQTKKR